MFEICIHFCTWKQKKYQKVSVLGISNYLKSEDSFYILKTIRISLASNSDFFYKTKEWSGKGEEYRVMEKGQIMFQNKVVSIRESSGYYLQLQKILKMLP